MKLEQQVTSLEISKHLKELGVKQESLFYYYKDEYDIDEFNWELGVLNDTISEPRLHGINYGLDVVHSKSPFVIDEYISAFTVAELGEMLPSAIKNNSAFLYIWKDDADEWRVDYSQWGMNKIGYMIEKENNQANAYGKMLIYLLENKLINE